MEISLKTRQEAWLREKVETGEFTSLDDALQTLISRAMILEEGSDLELTALERAALAADAVVTEPISCFRRDTLVTADEFRARRQQQMRRRGSSRD